MNTSTTPETEFVLGLLQRVGNTDEVDPYLREIGEANPDWNAILDLVSRHRLHAVLRRTLEEAEVDVPREIADRLEARHHEYSLKTCNTADSCTSYLSCSAQTTSQRSRTRDRCWQKWPMGPSGTDRSAISICSSLQMTWRRPVTCSNGAATSGSTSPTCRLRHLLTEHRSGGARSFALSTLTGTPG